MAKEDKSTTADDMFDIGSLFRNSAIITFVIEIVSLIIMLGALAAYFIGGLLPALDPDTTVFLLLIGSIVTLVVFLGAMSIFIRFSRKISNAVIGPGIDVVSLSEPKMKPVVIMYALLVGLMGVLGIYSWYLVHKNILGPLAGSSISLQIFSIALGAFFISLLIQFIIALSGRSATKMILGVLDQDDSEFD